MKPLHQPGDVIRDRYRILSILGQGGFGITYKAEDCIQGSNVAIKALSLSHLTDWKALELFEREANVLKNLRHDAIPQYLSHFQIDLPSDRLFYLVQELAEGESLAALVEQGWRTNEAEVRSIAAQVLEILQYLHSLTPPVIHRDIKPQNLIRRADGQVFLVDFGTVQSAYRNTLSVNTFVGTFGYMPPEQFRGQAFFASDLYSLGATLLFLLTHRSPADLPQQRMRIVFRDRIQVSNQFADWLEKMLEPAIEDRFDCAEAALAFLQQPGQIERSPLQLQQQSSTFIEESKGLEQSRVQVYRTSERLVIEIPPVGFQSPQGHQALMLTLGTFGLALLGFPLGWFFVVAAAIYSASTIAAFRRLEIDAESFCISWNCFNLHDRQVGLTADLAGASVEEIPLQDRDNFSHTSQLVLHAGIIHYFFGTEMGGGLAGQAINRAEQEWLAAEISDFLAQLRSSPST